MRGVVTMGLRNGNLDGSVYTYIVCRVVAYLVVYFSCVVVYASEEVRTLYSACSRG